MASLYWDLHILHSQDHNWWWPGNIRSQGISRYDIDLVRMEYPVTTVERVNKTLQSLALTHNVVRHKTIFLYAHLQVSLSNDVNTYVINLCSFACDISLVATLSHKVVAFMFICMLKTNSVSQLSWINDVYLIFLQMWLYLVYHQHLRCFHQLKKNDNNKINK